MMTKESVEKVFDKRIRPAIQMDGGNIELVEVRDNSVFVRLVGACGTCPSSQITLRQGVEGILREEFPEMVELVQC
ncbi:MAG: NifU family protein [Deltaproteobacteria bacterium]|nr:NifU family protein [Deltaproteobacteria bacterium]